MDTNSAPGFDIKGTRRVFSRIGFAVSVMIIVNVAVQTVGVMLVERFLPEYLEAGWMLLLLSLVPNYLVAIPVFFLLMRSIPAETPAGQSIGGGRWFSYLAVAFTGLYAGNFVSNIISLMVSVATGYVPSDPVSELLSGSGFVINIIFVGLLAPVLEELVFRKAVIDATRRYGEKTALVLSALIFGLIHMNIYQLFYAFAIGLVLGLVYLRTGKIIYSMLIHFTINMLSVLFSPLLLRAQEEIERITELFADESLGAVISETGEIPAEFLEAIKEIIPWYMLLMSYSAIIFGLAVTGIVILFKRRKYFTLERSPGDIPREYVGTTVYQNAGIVVMIILCTAMTAMMMFM